MKTLLFCLITLTICWSCKNNTSPKTIRTTPDTLIHDYLNGNFEKNLSGQALPDQWQKGGNEEYNVSTDTTTSRSGKYSVLIESTPKDTNQLLFGCIAQSIPARHKAQKMELKAWMKYEAIANGYIGLFLRIDGTNEVLAFDNMQQQKIQGSSDWKQFSVSLDYPADAVTITFGVLSTGSGKLWVDDLQLVLDGKNYNQLEDEYREQPIIADAKKDAAVNIISALHPLPASQTAERKYASELCEKFREMPADKMKAHPSASIFPGDLLRSVNRITRQIDFRHDPIPKSMRHITDNLYFSGKDNETMYSTGLYAAPGEIITVEIPEQLKGKISLQTGCHTDKLDVQWVKGDWRRMPDIIRKDLLEQKTTRLASAFGGLIYLTCPPLASACSGEIIIKGAVAAPHFILGKTTEEEWQKMLETTGAPWGELEGNDIIITCRTQALKDIGNPGRQTRMWDNIVNACYDLAQIPTPYFRKQRIVTDVQISVGYLHSGYPIMATHCPSLGMVCEDIITKGEKILQSNPQFSGWGFFHEIGHNMQNTKDWVFDGSTEVSVNFFSLYIVDHLVGGRDYAHEAITAANKQEMMKKYFKNGARFDDWKEDPFLGLIMFQQIQADFGWEVFKKVFRRFHEENAQNGNPAYSNQEKINNFMLYLSEASQHNLMPFFKTWGIPVTDQYAERLDKLPQWMPYNFPPQP